MIREHEYNPDRLVQEQLERWFAAPAFLASSSELRAQGLKNIGFKDVRLVEIPDSIEDEAYAKESTIIRKRWEDLYWQKVTEEIARAKVNYVLEYQDIPANATILAMDTMPLVLQYNRKAEDDFSEPLWITEHLRKPKSEEDLQKTIESTIIRIIKGHREVTSVFKRTLGNKDDRMSHEAAQKFSNSEYAPALVRVNTGMAIRLPNTHAIETFSSNVGLVSDNIIDLAENWGPAYAADLASVLIKAQREEGIDPMRISGGIDYNSSRVDRLLGLSYKSSESRTDFGTFKGMPKDTISRFLTDKAKTITQTEN